MRSHLHSDECLDGDQRDSAHVELSRHIEHDHVLDYSYSGLKHNPRRMRGQLS